MRIFSLYLHRNNSYIGKKTFVMPRRRRLRKVVAPPGFKGYKPYGARGKKSEKVELLYEEYEAIKLADYDGLNHLEASKLMGISRPTFARIYEAARQKIAKALVETREIVYRLRECSYGQKLVSVQRMPYAIYNTGNQNRAHLSAL